MLEAGLIYFESHKDNAICHFNNSAVGSGGKGIVKVEIMAEAIDPAAGSIRLITGE